MYFISTFLLFFLFILSSTQDPNDEFLQPQLVVVLNGQTRHYYQGEVLVREVSHDHHFNNYEFEDTDTLDSTPEFYESIEPYDYEQEIDWNDIRISRIYADIHDRKKQIDEDFPQGNSSNYEILEYLGDGTFSFVTRAKRLSDGEIVVLKQIKPEYLQYCKREARILQFLNKSNHNNTIVKMIDAYFNQSDPVIVFDNLHGSQTFDYKTYYNDLNYQEMKYYFRQLFIAINESHKKGIMHLDIKPSNIIFSGDQIQLIDWGVSEFYYPLKQYRTRVGTRHYRAPEQLIHYKYYDYSVDVWAMGCILAGVAFRKQPFFDGRHNDDQLYQIVKILGTREFYEFCLKYDVDIPHDLMEKLKGYERRPLSDFVDPLNESLATPIVIDLLERIFVYDHVHRLSAEEVLQHPFFRDNI